MHARNEWRHYRVSRQNVGTPNGQGDLTWSHYWKVTLPSYHPLWQGDDYDRTCYRRFSTHAQAVAWASSQSVRDTVIGVLESLLDEHQDAIVAAFCRIVIALEGP